MQNITIPAQSRQIRLSTEEERLLAQAIAAEAGDASLTVQIAIASVVFNRMESYQAPLSRVLLADGFFTCVREGRFPASPENGEEDSPVLERAWEAVRLALGGMDPTDGAVEFSHLRESGEEKSVWRIGDWEFPG